MYTTQTLLARFDSARMIESARHPQHGCFQLQFPVTLNSTPFRQQKSQFATLRLLSYALDDISFPVAHTIQTQDAALIAFASPVARLILQPETTSP